MSRYGLKSWRRSFVVVLGAIVLSAQPALASSKVSVEVQATTDEGIGRRLAFHLREQIGKSGSFESAATGKAVLKVVLVTLDLGEAANGVAYSYTFLIRSTEGGYDYFITSGVGTCGPNGATTCAAYVFDELGEELEKIRQILNADTQSTF